VEVGEGDKKVGREQRQVSQLNLVNSLRLCPQVYMSRRISVCKMRGVIKTLGSLEMRAMTSPENVPKFFQKNGGKGNLLILTYQHLYLKYI
jgi:hypothetical protein